MSAIDSMEVLELSFDRIVLLAQEKKSLGWRFANIHAVKKEEGFDLYYTYVERTGHAENYRVQIASDQQVPSISPIFISAFFFENETHDLFGVPFEGIVIDYAGTFYQVALDAPMNPDYKKGEKIMDNPNFTAYQKTIKEDTMSDEKLTSPNQQEFEADNLKKKDEIGNEDVAAFAGDASTTGDVETEACPPKDAE